MFIATAVQTVRRQFLLTQRVSRCPRPGESLRGIRKEKAMHMSFGMHARPNSTKWSDIRRGPPIEAVREHVRRVAKLAGLSAPETSGIAR